MNEGSVVAKRATQPIAEQERRKRPRLIVLMARQSLHYHAEAHGRCSMNQLRCLNSGHGWRS